MSDLDKYKEKINQVEDSSLESTTRMLALMEEVSEYLWASIWNMGVYYILPEPRIKKSEDIFKIYQKIYIYHAWGMVVLTLW